MFLLEKPNIGFLKLCLSYVPVHQESPRSDGFLSSAEFSEWASTVRLREDEPHPVLKQSQFMSLPAALQPQVCLVSSAITVRAFIVAVEFDP